MDNFTIIIPYYNGQQTIVRLLESIPRDLPVLLVDDHSAESPLALLDHYSNLAIMRPDEKGYFTGAVNRGIEACNTDVLVLNQDAVLEESGWQEVIAEKSGQYAMIGERINGNHPAFPNGYIQGTFMFLRRDLIQTIGLLNEKDYPLWGSTCEYQLRACRSGFEVLPLRPFPGLVHDRSGRFGAAIQDVLQKEPDKRSLFIRTPPEISIIVPCYNHGRYLPDLVNSFCGGPTSLGNFEPSTLQSFEIIIIDDASTDNTPAYCQQVASDWKAIRIKRLSKNAGTAAAINAGVQMSFGRFITVMGADDMREPWALEAMYRLALQRPDHYVYDEIMAFSNGQRRPDIYRKGAHIKAFNPVDLINKNYIHAGILLPKKAWHDVGGWPEAMRDGREDWAMNVALLANGWCGVYLAEQGYLYRREKQNRTLKNTSREHWQIFKTRIMQMYPELYNGSVDLMACCGSGRSTPAPKNKSKSGATMLMVAGSEGMTLLRYIGPSQLKQTFYGVNTGAQYPAGLVAPLIPVDDRDLYGPDNRRPGLLERMDHGKPLFMREPVAERPQPIPIPEPATVSDEPIADVVVDWRDSLPDPTELSAKEVLALELDADSWKVVLDAEKAGKNRKSVIAFIEGKLQ